MIVLLILCLPVLIFANLFFRRRLGMNGHERIHVNKIDSNYVITGNGLLINAQSMPIVRKGIFFDVLQANAGGKQIELGSIKPYKIIDAN